VLRHLRAENIERLRVARRIESEREFVFPETTVIMRDIWKYTLEIEKREVAAEPDATQPSARSNLPSPPPLAVAPDIDSLLSALDP